MIISIIKNAKTADTKAVPAADRPVLLSDPLVIDTPRRIWLPILHSIILNVRPWKAAANYRKIWTDRGSPLLVNSQDQCAALKALLTEEYGERVTVILGMRYGKPSLVAAMEQLREAPVDRMLILPLYPQFSHTTATTTFERIDELLAGRDNSPEVRRVQDYHDYPAYIAALAASIREHWQTNCRSEHLLMSFHGLPKRYVRKLHICWPASWGLNDINGL